MKAHYRSTAIALTFGLAGLLTNAPALAQEGQEQTPAPQEANSAGYGRDVVVVTAQKRAQDVQDIASAVSALGSDEIQQRGIDQASDLQFVVPNVQVGKQAGQTAVTIRGVGLNQGAPGVAIHVDGVYQPTSGMGDLGQLDIERVEVLRGPQGTLYGRNANGGVINFITREPTDAFEGYVRAGYASYRESSLQGVFNAPITDNVRARALINWRDRREGFVKNVLPGGQDVDKFSNLTGRVRVNADLSDTVSLDLSATQFQETGPSFYYNLNAQPLPGSALASFPQVIVPAVPWRTSINDPADSNRTYTMLSGTVNWQLGDWDLRSISGYQRAVDKYQTDNDTVNISLYPQTSNYYSKTVTEEVNLSGALGPVDAVFGAFFMDSQEARRSHFDIITGGGGLPPNSILHFETFDYDTTTYAAFGDMTWNLTDQLRILGGIRYSKDKQTQVQANFIRSGPTNTISTCPLRTNEIEFESTTPRAGVQYDISGDANLYFTASKGFKAGGFNILSCQQSFGPEQVVAYEGGFKSSFLNDSLTFNASAFQYDYDDLQLSQVVGLAVIITNAAAAEVRGLEFETQWQPDDYWTVSGNLSFLDATYKSFNNVDSLNPSLGVQDVSGNPLNDSPEVSANIGIAHRTEIGDAGVLTLRVDASHRSRYYFREFANPLDSQDGFELINLAAVWDSADEKYRVRIYGTNVSNQDYFVRMAGATALGGRYVTWGDPRQVGIELEARF